MTSLLGISGGLLITVFVILALIALAAILDITFLRARSAAREHEAAAAAAGSTAEPAAIVPAPAAEVAARRHPA
jgi:predicted lipid-binding transport protein (Tim44 family)